MGYQWNDLKNTILAKMDLTEEEANIQNLINRFPYYANEAITQICSSVKPLFEKKEYIASKVSQPLAAIGKPLFFMHVFSELHRKYNLLPFPCPLLRYAHKYSSWL